MADVKVKHKKTGEEKTLPEKVYNQLSDKYIFLGYVDDPNAKALKSSLGVVQDAGKEKGAKAPKQPSKKVEPKKEATKPNQLPAELTAKYKELLGEDPAPEMTEAEVISIINDLELNNIKG